MATTDQLTGASVEQARRVVDHLADLHAPWWGSPALDELTWMPDLHDPMINAVTVMFDAGWPAFCERYRGRLPERVFGWAETFVRGVPEWIAGYAEEPVTIVHGDARLDNMFFGDDGTFALVDWQMAMRSPGNTDLVYFVATNLTPDVRRRHERELLERYRQRMVAAGATGRGLTEDGLLARLPGRRAVLVREHGVEHPHPRPGQRAGSGPARRPRRAAVRGSRRPRLRPDGVGRLEVNPSAEEGGGGTAEERRNHERELLERYGQRMVAAGARAGGSPRTACSAATGRGSCSGA